jgi:hypothetical protein
MVSLKSLFLKENTSLSKVSMDIELVIRLLEWAHEEAKSDVEIHKLVENLELLSREHGALTMDFYQEIISGISNNSDIEEESY